MPRLLAPLLILLTIALTDSAALAASKDASKPNIVMIVSDDQAWNDFGFMGHEVIQTPRLDELASQSAVFPRGYVPSSLCRPSLATMITGLYPHQHLISGNDPTAPPGETSRKVWMRPDYRAKREKLIQHIEEVPTLPTLLAPLGYVSFQTGKWWEGKPSRGGFTAGMTHADPTRGGRHGDAGLRIGREGMQPIENFIKRSEDKPFFLWYAPFLPHSPHNPPERLLKKYQAAGRSIHVARYYAMCEWFDETCGQLLDHLDEQGLAENTIVLFVTDNGWIQSEDSSKYAPKSKRSQYDGGLRTPIMVRWPQHVEPAIYKETLVSSIDLAPTVLAAAGLEPTDQMPGLNLLEIADADGKTDRETIYGDIYAHDVANVDVPAESLLYRWCIRGDWKLIVPADDSDPVELYDLSEDPFETVNMAKEQSDRVATLTKAINDWWTP